MKFEIHTLQTAPEGSRATLASVEKAYKFIPYHLARTPLDAAIAGQKWTRPSQNPTANKS